MSSKCGVYFFIYYKAQIKKENELSVLLIVWQTSVHPFWLSEPFLFTYVIRIYYNIRNLTFLFNIKTKWIQEDDVYFCQSEN